MPTLDVRGSKIEFVAVQDGPFYRLNMKRSPEVYIMTKLVKQQSNKEFKITDNLVEDCLVQYQAGTLKLYRGIPRWHPLFPVVLAARDIANQSKVAALGTGKLPDFSGQDSAFIPFSPDLIVSSLFATAAKGGFGGPDEIQFVYGYNKGDHFRIGMLVSRTVGDEAIGFMNAGEVQLRGPLTVDIEQIYTMDMPVAKIWAGTALEEQQRQAYAGKTFGDEKMPDPASEQEKREYIKKYGALRHTPEGKKLEMTPVGIAAYLNDESVATHFLT